jgi:hypothetical protein
VAAAVLAAEIDELLSDPSQRIALSRAATRYAAATTYETVAERYLELLELQPASAGS